MPEIQIEPKRTPVTMQGYADAARAAWIPEMGDDAPYFSVATLWGQYMVETGGANCWNWNIGNVKRIVGDGNPWMVLKGNKENGVVVGAYASMFRAFPDLATAMRLHLRFLYSGRYAKAWNCIVAGAPEDCARELFDAGYYTGVKGTREQKIAVYAKGMRYHFDDFRRKIERWDLTGEDRLITAKDLRTIADVNAARDAVREDNVTTIVEGAAEAYRRDRDT